MKRILIIDDSTLFTEMLQTSLRNDGYTVDTACNGDEGLSQIKKNIPDLVITDILMPVMDGFEVVRAMKKNYPKIPIIVVTAGGFIKADEYAEAIKQFGADHTLVKPFKDECLKEMILKLSGTTNRFDAMANAC
jgi:two-component system, OmpR family, response regulator MprA